MSEDVKSKVTKAAGDVAPWRKGIAWWVVLLEGIALLGLGLFMYFNRSTANILIGWIVGLALAVAGGLNLYLALQATGKTPARQWTLYHGIAGLVAGLIIILLLLIRSSLSAGTILWLAGLGCLIYGGMGLFILLNPNLTSLRRVSVVGAIFYTAIGLLLILQALGMGAMTTTMLVVNMIIIIGGIVLILWAFILRKDAGQ